MTDRGGVNRVEYIGESVLRERGVVVLVVQSWPDARGCIGGVNSRDRSSGTASNKL